jgi:hypothetical protein
MPQREVIKLQAKIRARVAALGSIAAVGVAAEVHALALWVRHFSEQRRVQYRSRSVANWLTAVNGGADPGCS